MASPLLTTPFTGRLRGLHDRQQEVDVDPMFDRVAENIDYYQNVRSKRRGTHRLLEMPCAGRVHAIHNARFRNGTEQVIAAAGTKLQLVQGGAVLVDPPTDLPLSLPIGTPVRGGNVPTVITQLANRSYVANGVDLDVKWDGTNVTKLGIDPSATPAVDGPHVAGGLTGTFGFRATYVNADGSESEGSPELVVAYAAGASPITVPVSPDPQVTGTLLYRTTTNGGGVWLFCAEMPTNGGTFAALATGIPDDQLGTAMEEFLNDPPPGPMKLIAPWPQAGRLLGVAADNPSVVYYTDIGNGFLKCESWPRANIIPIAFDDGDEVVSIHAFFDSVIIRKRRSTWRVRGLPPDLVVEPVHFDEDRTGIGGFSQRGDTVVDDDLFCPGLDGGYTLARAGGGFGATRVTRAIDSLWSSITVGETKRIHAVFHRARRQVRLFVPVAPATEPDTCLVFQLDGDETGAPNGWAKWTIGATASSVIQTASGDVVYIGTADGFIEAMDQAGEDHWTGTTPGNGTPYNFIWEPVPFPPAAENQVDARGRRLDLVVRAEVRTTLTITPIMDVVIEQPPMTLVVDPGEGFILDTTLPDPPDPEAGVLDEDALGEASSMILPCVFLAVGRYHGFRVVNSEQTADFAIENHSYLWQALPPKHRAPATVQALG